MLNTQPAEKPWVHSEGRIQLHHAWRTIQGEGPLAGSPAVFFRLTGCNLVCPGCDTEYTAHRKELSVDEAVEEINRLHQKDLVVITGGEPFRQNIGPLVERLVAAGRMVQIETNGTMFLDSLPYASPLLMVVCSPKAGINPRLAPHIAAYKYVLQAGCIDSQDGLPRAVLGNLFGVGRPPVGSVVYVQPMDEQDDKKNKLNLEATVDVCFRHGYRLCLQTHKIIGLE